jgi:hypothetical protein
MKKIYFLFLCLLMVAEQVNPKNKKYYNLNYNIINKKKKLF